ncbi:MAG: VOC family protein [Planctomycetes bacterium]|nr:VOC family protein [Planctomycetota bacterium]MCW8136121.1 VOC family protein [Planctomycetota bacterium]
MGYNLGHVCHIEVAAIDMAASKAFYAKLFGWTFKPMADTYEFFDAGNIQGALDTDARPSREGTVLVLYCDDVNAKLAEIEKAGGKTIKGKTAIPGHGASYAYFEDPAGNRMGVFATD